MRRDSHTAGTSTHRPSRRLCKEFLGAALGRRAQPAERLEIGGTGILIDGVPAGLALAQLASGDPSENGGHLMDVSVTYDPVQAAHPYATHVCMVEVDPESAAVEIRRYVVADDCGTVINPMIVDGQVAGGIAQGVGAVLLEEIIYGSDGQLLISSFRGYLIPTAC